MSDELFSVLSLGVRGYGYFVNRLQTTDDNVDDDENERRSRYSWP